MQTKYTTGQAILIPAVIRSAREENGKVIYEVDADTWRGVSEDDIVIDKEASARAAFNKAMNELSRDIFIRH